MSRQLESYRSERFSRVWMPEMLEKSTLTHAAHVVNLFSPLGHLQSWRFLLAGISKQRSDQSSDMGNRTPSCLHQLSHHQLEMWGGRVLYTISRLFPHQTTISLEYPSWSQQISRVNPRNVIHYTQKYGLKSTTVFFWTRARRRGTKKKCSQLRC
jgi:hypothetical protein